MLLLKAFCATQANTVPLIFFFLCVCGVCFFLWFLFCLFCCFFFPPSHSLTVKAQEEKTDSKDQMGVHLLTLPLTVSYARYVFSSF